MISPKKNVLLVDNYSTSLAMTETSEYHVTMMSGAAFMNRVKVSIFLETTFHCVKGSILFCFIEHTKSLTA